MGSGTFDMHFDAFVWGKWSLTASEFGSWFTHLRNDTDALKNVGRLRGERVVSFNQRVVLLPLLCCCCVGGVCCSISANMFKCSTTFFKMTFFVKNAKCLSILLPLKAPVFGSCSTFHLNKVLRQVITSMSDQDRDVFSFWHSWMSKYPAPEKTLCYFTQVERPCFLKSKVNISLTIRRFHKCHTVLMNI